MKTITTQPTLPLSIKSNQYGYSPAKTYFYIVDANNLIFHRDKKWRKKSLIEMNKYAYCTESSAKISMGYLIERFKKSLWRHEMELETANIKTNWITDAVNEIDRHESITILKAKYGSRG